MKRLKKIIALLLAAVMFTETLTGCTKVKDDSAYMRKGEFLLLFQDAIGLEPNYEADLKIDLGEDSRYYDAALLMAQLELLTPEEAVSDLDLAVTKEFVATLCVRHLYFRKTFSDIKIKDEVKLQDPQLCKDAVGHEIVSLENGYFNAPQKMTYDDCVAAIDRMAEIDSKTKYDKEDYEASVTLKEDVLNLTEYFDDETFSFVDPSDENFEEIINGMSTGENVSDAGTGGSDLGPLARSRRTGQLGERTALDDPKSPTTLPLPVEGTYPTIDEAQDDDLIVVQIAKRICDGLKGTGKELEIGKMVVYGLDQAMVVSGQGNIQGYEKNQINCKNTIAGEIVAMNTILESPCYYLTLRIASEEEVMDSAILNGYTSSSQGKKLQVSSEVSDAVNSLLKEYGLDALKINASGTGVSVHLEKTLENTTASWRDAKLSLKLEYDFEIKDIAFTVNGFGNVWRGDIDGAYCAVDYNVSQTVKASSPSGGLRLTPDDNRNGKFYNNLSRSRVTNNDAPGATGIKIARIPFEVGAGFNIELYIYLSIHLDGTISISVSTDYTRGFKIHKNSNGTWVEPIKNKISQKKLDISANLEVAVKCDVSVRWIRKTGKNPLIKVTLGGGIGFDAQSTFRKKTTVTENGNIIRSHQDYVGYATKEEMQAGKEGLAILQESDPTISSVEYCIDIKCYWFIDFTGLGDDCKVGKVIRWFKSDFEWKKRLGGVEDGLIKEWRWGTLTDDDGYEELTEEQRKEKQEKLKVSADQTFVLNKYKMIIPDYTCDVYQILEYPAGSEALEEMGGITVRTTDESIAIAHMSGSHQGTVVIEAVGPGSTQLIIETGNKRFTQECSITITENNFD